MSSPALTSSIMDQSYSPEAWTRQQSFMETVGRCNTDCVGLVPTFFSADVRSNDGHSIDGRQVSDERVKKPEDSITLRYVNQKSSSQAEEEEDGEDCQEIAASFSPSTVHHCPVHSHYHLNRHGSDQSSTTGTVTGTNHSSFRDSDVDQDKNDWERWRDDSQQLPKRPQRGTEAENNKSEAKTSTIRQHYYPEGGWGWLVCACAFVVHLLTTGLQLSYGTFYLEVLDKFGSENVVVTGWLGALSFAVSLFLAPCVVAVCRRKSTRLTAVLGGLVMALAFLFTSFAQQMHQVFLSYGIMLGLGVGLTRETANLMTGQYFKRKRETVEMIVQTGSGIGTSLFSVFFKEAIGSVGWRLGLQAVTGVVFSTFILGILYRSASLYHPQRRAILHLKNQTKKVKNKNRITDKPPYFDFSTIKTHTLQIIMLSSGIAAIGIYTPAFYLAVQCKEEGLDTNSIIILQTFVGFAFAIGNIGFGLVVIRRSDQCLIGRQYLCQANLCGLGITILVLATIRGYHSYVLFAWMYGIFLGGYHFSLKMYTFEKVRARYFSRAWGFVQWAMSLPVLFGVPIAGYINQDRNYKSGFYFACVFTFLGAFCMFLMNLRNQRLSKRDQTVTFGTAESRLLPLVIYKNHENALGGGRVEKGLGLEKNAKSFSFTTSMDIPDIDRSNYLTCITEERIGGELPFSDFYPCDCLTSSDRVARSMLFSQLQNNLQEEEQVMDLKSLQPVPQTSSQRDTIFHIRCPRLDENVSVGDDNDGDDDEEEEEEEEDDENELQIQEENTKDRERSDNVNKDVIPSVMRAQIPANTSRSCRATRPQRDVTVVEQMTTSV